MDDLQIPRRGEAGDYNCQYQDGSSKPPSPDLPVSSDVTHEQDAGKHVEVKGSKAKVAVDAVDGNGGAGVVGNVEGETETDQEVSSCQVFQVDHHLAGHPLLSLTQIELHGEAV